MSNENFDEEIEEIEGYQLDQYAALCETPVDYSNGFADYFISVLDPESAIGTVDGDLLQIPAKSRYDNPAYIRMILRYCQEFMLACPIASENVAAPAIALWPDKIPGGFYSELSTGRPLIMFSEGAFLFFDKSFGAIANSCYSVLSSSEKSEEYEEISEYRVKDFSDSESFDKSYELFRIAILGLIFRTSSHDLRAELGLPLQGSRPKLPNEFQKSIDFIDLDKAFTLEFFRSQCYRFLFGHEFSHILLSKGIIEKLDYIPPLAVRNIDLRQAYNLEINCDIIGVEYAIKYGKETGLEPELIYAGVFLFFMFGTLYVVLYGACNSKICRRPLI